MVLEGRAQQETERVVYLRVAEAGGRVYIDMGDTTGRVIEIGGGQWHFVDSAPVLFRRTKLTGAMPYPAPRRTVAVVGLCAHRHVGPADALGVHGAGTHPS